MREPAREKEKTGPEIGGSRGLGWFLGVWKGIQYPNRNFKVYLTTISLPCAYIKAEFEEDHDLDNIKVDLYLPTFGEYKQVGNGKYKLKNNEDSDDSVRQSFMLFRKEVPELYEAFSKNINDILLHAEEISFHTEEENDDEI